MAARIVQNSYGKSRVRLVKVELHSHAFVQGSAEKRTAHITATRDAVTVESGIEDLVVLKSAGSGFTGFIHDRYTTLPEAADRILSTSITATWRYGKAIDGRE